MVRRISVLGPGLLGGSVALAVRHYMPEVEVVMWGRRDEPLQVAKELGVSVVTTEIEEAVNGVDLCVLATPVGVMSHLVSQIVEAMNGEALLLTDVGSVKRLPHQTLASILQGSKVEFVGSHPMAGSEKTGIEAARALLLDGATCLVTNDNNVEEEQVQKVEEFWQNIGCKIRRMSAEDHDYAVARVSHFPHLLAAVGATVGLAFEDILNLCGGGMRDTTRVAAGDPELWTEILMENSDALHRSMRESVADLVNLMDCLEGQDSDRLLEYLIEAKRRRDLI